MNTFANRENPAWPAQVALPHPDEMSYRSDSVPYLSDAREYDKSLREDDCEIWEDELSDSDEDASDWETVFSDYVDEDYDDHPPSGEGHRGYYDHCESYEQYEDSHSLSGSGSDWPHMRFEQVEPEHPFDGHIAEDIDIDIDRDSGVDMLHFSEEGVRLLMSPSIGQGTDECGSGFVIQAWLVADGSPTDAVRVVTGMVCEYEEEPRARGLIQERPILRVSRNSGSGRCKHGHGPGAGRRLLAEQ